MFIISNLVELRMEKLMLSHHCVKSVRIQCYSGPHFPAFGLNTERYGASLRIQSKCGITQARKTPNTDAFHTVTTLHYTNKYSLDL